MRALTKILEKIGHALESPEGAYCAMWYYPPMFAPTRAAAHWAALRREPEEHG